MTYATIEDGESTPLQGGHSDEAISGHTSTNKRAVAAIVRAVLLMADHSKLMMNSSSNVDTMVVVSSAATQGTDITKCAPATGPFSGLSCKDAFGYCAGPGESFGEHSAMDHYETCYVSNNDSSND